ncbi:hypothetical protein [Undibacterium sp. Ji49W]|uniref:hypothetical protein n=1 Tax=Undibacterium sp. Ji49W TaxID=3413040 RepID=UPI003BF3238A
MQDVRTSYVFTRIKRELFLIEKLAYVALAISVVGTFFWFRHLNMLNVFTLEKMWGMFSLRHPERWGGLVFGLALVLVQSIMQWSYRSARLVVNAEGLRLEQTSTSLLANLTFFGREMRWNDLKSVSFIPRFGVLQLRSHAHKLPWAILSKDWQLQNAGATPVTDKNAEPALVRLFREHGVFDSFVADSNLDAVMFDLTKHPATKKVLIGMAVLVVYGFVDRFLQNEAWAFFNASYGMPHVLAGVLASLVLGLFLFMASRERIVPVRIILGLAVLSGTMFAGASYVGGIRINQLLGGPLLEAHYHRNIPCDALVPEDKSLPIIEYTSLARAYWCSKTVDEVVIVKVRKGLFGLYQVDLSEHRSAIREYRQNH